MEEFHFAEGGTGRGRNIGRIVGFREHVFTHDVSAVANFFSLQELNFVSATQRVLDAPLHVSCTNQGKKKVEICHCTRGPLYGPIVLLVCVNGVGAHGGLYDSLLFWTALEKEGSRKGRTG